MDIEQVRKLIALLCLDGSISICNTCLHLNKEIRLCPYSDGRCDSHLSYYEPNAELLK